MATKTQQFCLRWNNHQASLASSLPGLLDSSRFTDVTLSAGGRTVRAHRILLASCSDFFSELFAALAPSAQPVIVLPGVPYSSLCALMTFVYSGEVTIFEDQLLSILSLADALGIKGLANQQQTTSVTQENVECAMDYSCSERTSEKQISPETKYRTIRPQSPNADVSTLFPHNFNASEKQTTIINNNIRNNFGLGSNSNIYSPYTNSSKPIESEISKSENDVDSVLDNGKEPRKIDIIAELLKCGAGKRDPIPQPPVEPQGKTYATCFICQKRLSNQYNLRVHMDTHRDAQYACHVCRHVSRSRDALRKHVSYRHPGGGTRNPESNQSRKRNIIKGSSGILQQQPSITENSGGVFHPSGVLVLIKDSL
ncbi:protein abrupt-like [Ctenocephalides felis]|uniref:protein abrupt-like n=1 Tax=Ctenocephalides felis TaxID=7515 RepID=UPI000E6E3276|nr:protein abrupt-like [Ctenocephalides felis]